MFYFLLEKLLFFLLNIVFILLCIAIFTLIERKVMSSVQRRKGPNLTGLFGFLQPFADGLKLLIKEIIIPLNTNIFIFFLLYLFDIIVFFINKNKKMMYIKRRCSKCIHYYQKRNYSSYVFSNKDKNVIVDSTEWIFTFDFFGTVLNDRLNYKDIDLFLKNELNIYNYLITSELNSKLKFLQIGDSSDKDFDIHLWNYRKKNNHGLYTYFYGDIDYSKYTNEPFNLYKYIFYKKKINIFVDDVEYEIYLIYYLEDDYSFDGPYLFDGAHEVTYSARYIYKNINLCSFKYDETVVTAIDNKIIERTKELAEDKRDPFFRKELLHAISELVKNNMVQIASKFIKDNSKLLKSNIFSNQKRHYHIKKLKINYNYKCYFYTHFSLFMKMNVNNFISNTYKIHSVCKLNTIGNTELKKYFSPELFSNNLFKHRYFIINDAKVIDESYNYKIGIFLFSLTSNKLSTNKDLDINSKFISSVIGNWNHNSTKIFEKVYFIEESSSFFNANINYLQHQKITKFPILKQLLDYSLSKNYIHFVEAMTNKNVFTTDNIHFSGLNFENIDESKLSNLLSYSCDKDGYLLSNNIFLPAIPLKYDVNSITKNKIINFNNIDLNTDHENHENHESINNNLITQTDYEQKIYFEKLEKNLIDVFETEDL